jgi:ParB family transcriptional regulator, chromosome partitioning protein
MSTKSAARHHISIGGSEKNQWFTPRHIIEKVHRTMGGIDLDPASCEAANEVVQAGAFYTEQTSGLDHPWFGRVFLNPPYSGGLITKFTDKLLVELPKLEAAIVLTDSHTDPMWFYNLTQASQAVCITKSRLWFWQKVKTFDVTEGKEVVQERECWPRHGQVLFYFGKDPAAFCHEFADVGNCLTLAKF